MRASCFLRTDLAGVLLLSARIRVLQYQAMCHTQRLMEKISSTGVAGYRGARGGGNGRNVKPQARSLIVLSMVRRHAGNDFFSLAPRALVNGQKPHLIRKAGQRIRVGKTTGVVG